MATETTLTTKIKVKRNVNDTFADIASAQAADTSKKLAFGEPLYIAKEDYLVIGGTDETQTVSDNGKVIRLLSKDQADSIGTMWLDGFRFDATTYTKYKINPDGTISDETTDTVPCAVKVRATSGEASKNHLANIKATMKPSLSVYIPATYRGNADFCKASNKQFAFISSGETVDGGINLFFAKKFPTTAFYINLMGG